MNRHLPALLCALLSAACTSSSGPVTVAPPAADVRAPAPVASHAPPPPEVKPPPPRAVGPFEAPFATHRNVYFAIPPEAGGKHRLIANLHGLCNPPGYACGYWVPAATERGFLVCPAGNATCGAGGPPTWTESFDATDADLERAVAAVEARYPGEIDREGAVLTGFSRGAYMAPYLARKHPGRWPYLVLIEADVTLSAGSLRKAGVRAVAMLAGEWGTQIAGERATVKRLRAQGFPAKLWVMKKAGHNYSADIDALMAEAIDFVVGAGASDGDRG